MFVAISGGGARATALASHALAILEEKYNAYNHANLPKPDFVPLVDRIAAFSTVSGGSLYAHNAAQLKTLLDDAQKTIDTKPGSLHTWYKRWEEEQALHSLRTTFFTSLIPSAEDVGLFTALSYPRNALLLLATDVNYLHLLSDGLYYDAALHRLYWTRMVSNITGNGLATPIAMNTVWDLLRSDPTEIKLADLTPTPRLFFNATILETGLPFVFTQRFTNLPTKNLYGQTARLDLKMQNKNDEDMRTLKKLRPLGATTLEDINSSPTTVPAAMAAMAI